MAYREKNKTGNGRAGSSVAKSKICRAGLTVRERI